MSQLGVFEQLIEALNANTAAILASKGSAPAGSSEEKKTSTTAKSTKGSAKDKADTKPKATHTKQEVTDAIVTVKDKLGVDAAKTVLAIGKVAKLADIKEEFFDAMYDKAQELLGEDDSGSDEPEDDI